jgi:glycosyltransferase involved in cell wall biosynthesis
MSENRPVRIMWLLNHTTARKFELSMMKQLGFTEFFLPKIIPSDPGFRSGSVDASEDANLTIPASDLEVLNQTDWYGEPSKAAWAIANRHFDVLFFIIASDHADTARHVARNFQGSVIWRTYGQGDAMSYSRVLNLVTAGLGEHYLKSLGPRFWFGAAYKEIVVREDRFLRDRAIYLPLGMQDQTLRTDWTGEERAIFFVCPDVGANSYYRSIYETFKKDFDGFPYAVGGAQSVKVPDRAVLGYLPLSEYESSMRRYRVMFYHSTEGAHVHYHPFEAVRSGMPLVFMANSLLDKLGGAGLPGRCTTIAEARGKIRRILDGDARLIKAIRDSQHKLLTPMKPENCLDDWKIGMPRILGALEKTRAWARPVVRRKPRIGVILPIAYGGGTFRSAKQLAQALLLGSRRMGEDSEIVFGHPVDPQAYPDAAFDDLPAEIKRRPFKWRCLDADQAAITCAYAIAGYQAVEAAPRLIPEDGINHFLDCDLWVVISDRLSVPLSPVRPYVMIVHDYVQRYGPGVEPSSNLSSLTVAHRALRVLVTSRFTLADALQYAGLREEKLRLVPLILPSLPETREHRPLPGDKPFFLWPTNRAEHKNHANAGEALSRYFEELDGQLECLVTGVGTDAVMASEIPHMKEFLASRAASRRMKRKLRFMGNLPDARYADLLARAAFIWHPARIDNGSFSVIEGAMRGVPSLSSDYPAMHDIDERFQLGLTWMDAYDPGDMAQKLKYMEENASALREGLPGPEILERHSVDRLATAYWEVVRECL